MSAPSAWTIQAAMAAAQAALSRLETSGDVDTDEAAALAVLREDAPEIDVVILRLVRAIGEAAANKDAVAARITDLSERKARFDRQHSEYRSTLFAVLEALGRDNWRHAEATVSVQPGRAGVWITDEAAVPDQFVRTTRVPDKVAIGTALAGGHVVPGAEMRNGAPTLVIRSK